MLNLGWSPLETIIWPLEDMYLTTSYLEATKNQNYTFSYPRHENQNFTKLSLSLGSLEKGKRGGKMGDRG
jgi:hypothetical protein